MRHNTVMHIARCLIELDLPDVYSLKEKRSIIKPILKRLPRQFNVAVAEVDYQDRWNMTLIALVTVGNDARYLHGLLEKAVAWVERERPDAPLAYYSIEID